MKIASWNVNSLKVRLPQVLAWLAVHRPEVLAVQETKTSDDRFPVAAFDEAGWRVHFSGQRTYNGVAMITRSEASDVVTDLAGLDDPQRRVVAATIGGVRIYNLYVPNGQEPGSEKFDYKLQWFRHLLAQVAHELNHHDEIAVVGDFNIAPADADVHDPEALAGQIHCSQPEREALGRLFDLGFVDTFRRFEQPAKAFSWWDYRAAAFRRNQGLRIDLILASPTLAQRCTSSAIDVEPRRNERPSDHAPVIAEFS